MLPYLVYPVVVLTALAVICLPRERRLGPIALVGSVHLIYNLMSILLSQRSHQTAEYLATVASFVAFVIGVVVSGRIVRQRRERRGPSPAGRTTAASSPAAPSLRAGWSPDSLVARWRAATLVPQDRVLEIHDLRIRLVPYLITFLVSAGCFGYLVVHAGTPPILDASPNSARLVFFVNGYFATLVYVGFVACAVAGGMVALSPRGSRHLPLSGVIIFVSLASLAATGNRGMLLYPVLVLALYSLLRFRIRFAYVMTTAVLGMLAFSVSGYYRNKAAFGYTYDNDLAAAGYPGILKFLGPIGSYVGGTAETFSRTIDVFPHQLPFAWGTQFFSPLLHRESVDLYLKDVFNLDFEGYGLALGAMNAFYLDFGWPGVVVGFLVLGAVAGCLYELAVDLGGIYVAAYVLLCANLLLANYGHPFAYIATIAAPVAVCALLATVAGDPPRRIGGAKATRGDRWLSVRRTRSTGSRTSS